ncbi:MAG: hypothetical protein VXY91_00720 [Bacteroidota bacterium]|nr:hypothetical protein [Bacteroidota bacterium]
MPYGVFMTILLKTTRFKALVYMTFVLTFGLSGSLLGQTNSVSPLSINGFGETSFGVTPNYLAMGGTGIANVDRFSINMFNPAGYMNLDFVTLEMSGAHRSFRHRITDEDIDQANFNTYFDFFGFGFKFNNYFAGSFLITPIAAKGYNISIADSSDDFGLFEYRSNGSGGYDKFNFGLASQPLKWLSIGVNAKYIFGEIDESNKTIIADPAFLSVNNSKQTGISDFTFDFGAQMKFNWAEYRFTAGAVYALGQELNARQINSQYTFINNGVLETAVDTLFYKSGERGKVKLPSSYGMGIGFSKSITNSSISAWDVLVDYNMTHWEEYRSFIPFGGSNPGPTMFNSKRISFGAAMVPAYSLSSLGKSRNYFVLARYRIGAFQETGQYQWDGVGYTSREVNAGISFPVIYRSLAPGEKKASFLNISIGRGQRWDGNSASLREEYWNFNLGVTLNDKWFQKFRYR